jgi:predicted ATPase
MIAAIHARENHEPRNIQLIIESHSEHFLRRLQRRIAEGVLDAEDFRAYFVNTEKFPPSLDSLQIDLFGEIANWSKGFFGDIAGDVYAQTDAALQRRISKLAK